MSILTLTVADLPKTVTLWSRGMGPASGRPFSPISVALGKDVMLVTRKEDLLDALDFTSFWNARYPLLHL